MHVMHMYCMLQGFKHFDSMQLYNLNTDQPKCLPNSNTKYIENHLKNQ